MAAGSAPESNICSTHYKLTGVLWNFSCFKETYMCLLKIITLTGLTSAYQSVFIQYMQCICMCMCTCMQHTWPYDKHIHIAKCICTYMQHAWPYDNIIACGMHIGFTLGILGIRVTIMLMFMSCSWYMHAKYLKSMHVTWKMHVYWHSTMQATHAC